MDREIPSIYYDMTPEESRRRPELIPHLSGQAVVRRVERDGQTDWQLLSYSLGELDPGPLGELDPAKRYVVNCQSGLRSYIACRILSQHGFRCVNVSGGYGFVSAVMKQTPPDREEAFPCGVKPGDL